MKVALIHDYLNQWGGGERVLEVLCEMFPEAPIYTLLYDPAKMGGRFFGRDIRTSFLDFPLARKHHRLFIPFMPLAALSLKLSKDFDFVISDSASFGKGIGVPKGVPHFCYCHTPLRYAWEEDFIKSKIKNQKLKILYPLARPVLNYLKNWDFRAAQKPNVMLANSAFIAQKIKKYYHRDAQVLYPPVDTVFFHYDPKIKRSDYFLAAGRLIHYKKFDLIIEAFNELRLPLKIAGSGPELKKLKSFSRSPLIEFVGAEDDAGMRRLYQSARALIFPQVEDFGLVAAEATSCGTPVIAYAAGGALEIVKDGESGLFFREQTPVSLRAAISKFSAQNFNHATVAASAQKFSVDKFKQGIRFAIQNLKI